MLRRQFERAVLVGVLMGGASTAAHAQDEAVEADAAAPVVEAGAADEGAPADAAPSDSAAEAAPEAVAPVLDDVPAVGSLSEGLAAFEREDYGAAALRFWDALRQYGPGDAEYSRAQYELARSLVRLELYQSSVIFFDEILLEGEGHPYFEATIPWLVTIARAIPGDTSMLNRLSAFASVFPTGVEPRYQHELAYLIARHYYEVAELGLAQQFLAAVGTDSEFYEEALFLSAITHVRDYDAREASEKLNELRRVLENASRGDEEAQELADLAQITMARTFYSAGQYEDSIRFYDDIEQSNVYWLDSLFESSWAYFQLDQYNRALGNLHSLNSPFFNDQYYPEAPILQAVIQFYNCRFREVRTTLEDFTYVYVPLREELEFKLISMVSPEEVYDFIRSSSSSQTEEFDPRLQQILTATLSERRLREAVDFVDALDEESARLAASGDAFRTSAVGAFLEAQLTTIRSASVDNAGALGRERLQFVLNELRQKEREASAILVETDLAEANALSADLASELAVGGGTQSDEITVPRDYIQWPFEGEYWRDELGHYYYRIASRCVGTPDE